ncbi:MAG: retroviral-like aspartic protease family protein [Acidobacteriota bacterium]
MAILAGAAAGCALYSDVYVQPLRMVPTDVRRGSDIADSVAIGDYGRAIELAHMVDEKARPTASELLLLGRAEMISGRIDAARQHLTRAWEMDAVRESPQIAWTLSQTEYMSKDFAAASRWAEIAFNHGIRVVPWHREFLRSLSSVHVNAMTEPHSVTVPMGYGNPRIPRIDVHVNGTPIRAVIDSGAVLSIISRELAEKTNARLLGTFTGTFFGLLGEPIAVSFATIDTLDIGGLIIHDVPVAIMPDEKMNFFVVNRQTMKMDLLLGASLLREFRTELDFRRKRVTLTPVVLLPFAPADDQNLFLVGFRPVIKTAINRRGWYLFLLDTGSEVSFLNDRLVGTTRVRYSPRLHGALLQGLGGARKRGEKIERVELGICEWGGLFRTIPLYSSEKDDTVGIVGENFLEHFKVTLDFSRMRLDITPD